MMRDWMLFPKNGNKIRILLWPLLFNTELENLARAIRQKKRFTQVEKKK